jgi:hypothetical protein
MKTMGHWADAAITELTQRLSIYLPFACSMRAIVGKFL